MSQVLTIDDLENYMVGKTLDPGLGQQVVDGLNTWVETQTGRCFGETKQVAERYDWGQNPIWLRHMDLISVDAVTLGWPGQPTSDLPATNFYSNPLGRVTFFNYSTGSSRLYNDYALIQYTYGIESVPDDLKSACLGIAAGFYNWALNGNRDVASVAVGSYQIEYTNRRASAGTAPDPATSSSDANWAVITSYKLRRQ